MGSFSFGTFELDGIQVSIPHHEAEPHRLSSESADVGTGFPRHLAIDLVADLHLAILDGKARDRLAVGFLDPHFHAAGGRGGEVQRQLPPGEDQRLCDRMSAGIATVERRESIDPQRITSQVGGGLGIVLVHIDRHLGRAGGDDIQRGIVRPRDPVLRADAGPDEAFRKGAVVYGEMIRPFSRAGRHEDGV